MKNPVIVLSAVVVLTTSSFAGALHVGFGRVDITPPTGAFMPGYYSARYAEGADTPLCAECLAFSNGTTRALAFSLDNLHATNRDIAAMRKALLAATGIPAERLFIASTHIHTGAATDTSYYAEIEQAEGQRICDLYGQFLAARVVDAARMALADLAPTTAAVGRAKCPGLSFIRRYRMKDGSVETNPRVPENIDHALGEADDVLQVVRFRRTGAPDIAMVNFQTHPDTVGGLRYNADWPGVLRRTFERALEDGTHCFFLNGAQGDANHFCFHHPSAGRQELMKQKQSQMHLHMGHALAGAALGIWDECIPVSTEGGIRGAITTARIPSNRPTADEIRYIRLYDAGRASEIPLGNMELTTLVDPNSRARRLMNGPDHFDMPITSLAVSDAIALAGFPGEPFTAIGQQIKAGSPFKVTFVACLTNGSFGYIPSSAAYAEGGYEVLSSKFAAPAGGLVVDTQLEQLKRLANR